MKIVFLAAGFFLTLAATAVGESLSMTGVSADDDIQTAADTLEDRGFACAKGVDVPTSDISNEKRTSMIFACNIPNEPALIDLDAELTAKSRDPNSELTILLKDLAIPAVSRSGQIRIVSSKEIDALYWLAATLASAASTIRVAVGYELDGGFDMYFSCAVSSACGRSPLEVSDAMMKQPGAAANSLAPRTPDLLRDLLELAGESNFGEQDAKIVKTAIKWISARVELTEELVVCVNGYDGASMCNYDGFLHLSVEPGEIASQLLVSDSRAVELSILGLRVPIHFVYLTSREPSGRLDFQ